MIKLLKLTTNNFKQLRGVELVFPSSGSILIEGRNEAGKSTLFEAIYFGLFGRPLISGTSAQDLLAYEADAGIVELTIAVPDGEFVIQRRLSRTRTGAATSARLRILKPGGEVGEDIKGATAVNQRIQQELLLDADAFLNSCFVEQKKLEKLEGMTKQARETSLMRLLNLDRLLDHEKAMSVTGEDERRLERLGTRTELATVMARIPEVQKRGTEIKVSLGIIEMKEGLAALGQHEAAAREADERLEALREPIADMEARLSRIEAVKAAVHEVNVILARLEKLEQLAQQIAGTAEQVAELDRLECQELPGLTRRRREIAVLWSRWARLLRLDATAAEVRLDAEGSRHRLQAWDNAREALAAAEERLSALEGPIGALDARLQRAEVLRAAHGAADLAAAVLAQIAGFENSVAQAATEIAELDALEAERLPTLLQHRRSAVVARSQWTRIARLRQEVEQLRAEAAGVRKRLQDIAQARADLAEMEEQAREHEARAAELEAQESQLDEASRAVSLRQALEDWQAADHARRSLADIEARMADAEREQAEAESGAEAVRAEIAGSRGAARSRLAVGAGATGAAIVLATAAAVAGIAWLWTPVAILAAFGAAFLGQWRAAHARAQASAQRYESLSERVRATQSALVRLGGQYENAQASHRSAAGRLEAAVLRIEALDEPPPASAAEAERRLAELPNVGAAESPETLRDRLAAVRTDRAVLSSARSQHEAAVAQRRQEAEAENEALLQASADRLEAFAARIAETVVDRWTEAATARCAALSIPVEPNPSTNREAAGNAIVGIEAEIRGARQQLAGRGAKADQIAHLRMSIEEERRHVEAVCQPLRALQSFTAAPATINDVNALKAVIAAEIEQVDEAAARRDRAARLEERAAAERDRTTAERDARVARGELAARFAPAQDASPEQEREAYLQAITHLDQQAHRVEAVVARWAEVAAERAARLGLPAGDDMEANRDAAFGAESGVKTEIVAAQKHLSQRPTLQQRIAEIEAKAVAERQAIAASLTAVPRVRPDAAVPEACEDADALLKDLRGELQSLDEDGVRATLKQQREAQNKAINDRTNHNWSGDQVRTQLRDVAGRLNTPSDTPLTEEALAAAIPRWNTVEPDQKPGLELEFETLRQENGYLTGRRADLAKALGLDPDRETLDPEKERAAYEALNRDHEERKLAGQILNLARDRIVGKVLPYTIEHMRRILPSLTMDRYHDAKLTDEYKIEVWDERASMWKTKNIFSGGTRDQFSLALRLAFAMATLPQERGAAPGFIFLDEPLSSFDLERADALMYLLTRGEVAEMFDQIFVISHSQNMGSAEFTHRLRLDGGRIAECSDEMKPARDLAGMMEE